jgi:sugar lactone lactonase YvrE
MRKLKHILAVFFLWTSVHAQDDGTIITIAGGGTDLLGSGIPATDARLNVPQDIAIDNDGNIYIADSFSNIIRRIDAQTGLITTFAGTGTPGFEGDNGPATDAELNFPRAVGVNGLGEVFIGDTNNFRIRKVDPVTGEITTIAGFGTRGTFPSRLLFVHADSLRFGEITSIFAGNSLLLIGEGINADLGSGNNQILLMDLGTDSIRVLAGTGNQKASGDGGDALNAGLTVEGIALDSFGRGIFADPQNHQVRFFETAFADDEDNSAFQKIDLLAGNGFTTNFGSEGTFSGDGGPATDAGLDLPWGVTVGLDDRVYIMDLANHRIRSVEPDGSIVTVAGITPGNADFGGFSGDGGLALNATLDQPLRAGVDPDGNLIFIDLGNNLIRKIFRPEFRTSILEVSATAFNFGPVSLGIVASRTLTLMNFGNKALTVESVLSSNPLFITEFQTPATIGPNQSKTIDIVFQAVNEDFVDGTLTIATSDPSQPLLTIPLSGSGIVPDIDVLPNELTFDPTFTDQTSQLTLRVSNLTQGQLFLEGISVSDTTNFSFTLLTENNFIQAGQFERINVRFHPKQAGPLTATLNILSNDPDEQEFIVQLSGIGLVPKPGGFVNVAQEMGVANPGASFGVAWSDFDRDGDPDIYIVRSLQPNSLYRNDGTTFTDIAAEAGVNDTGDGSGAAWADYDGDGDLDIYETNFGQPNKLYRNDGGSFTDVAAVAGVDDIGDGFGAVWSDYDRDGDPDLYVANFGANVFFHNLGDGRFEEIANQLGIADSSSGIQPAFLDYDNDGDPDLFLANSGPNRFWKNNGDGTFEDASDAFVPRDSGASTGAAVGDFDNDGFLDLYVPHFGNNRLYRNLDGNGFADLAPSLGVADPGNGRGAVWGDFDNDGFLDLFVSNRDSENLIFRNPNGQSEFIEVGEDFGVNTIADSRGVALADFDGDGGLDLFVAIQNDPDQLFRNFEAEGNWLIVTPQGTTSSFDAIGTRLRIVYDRNHSAIREIAGGTSFLSQDALSAAFGIGTAETIDTLDIRWPSGTFQSFRRDDIGINRVLTVLEEDPLPPVDLLVTNTTNILIANGTARTELTITLLNQEGEISYVSDRDVDFILNAGGGKVTSSGPSIVDGFASAQFTSGLLPGTIPLSIVVTGLPTERVLLRLIPPLLASDTFIRSVSGSGNGGFAGDGEPATEALLNQPRAVAIDSAGNVYIADSANNRIRRVSASDSIITTVAGTGTGGIGGAREGPAIDTDISDPRGIFVLPDGDLIVSESGGQLVRRIDLSTGITSGFAGSGFAGFGGDGGPATRANMTTPRGVTSDSLGRVYIADRNNRTVWRLVDDLISTFAGDALGFFSFEDNVPAKESSLTTPNGVALDSEGNLYIAEELDHRIRKVDTAGRISTFAGTGVSGSGGDGGPATFARLNAPQDVVYDPRGKLYVSDSKNHQIRAIDLTSGIIQTIAGTGRSGSNGNQGTSLDFSLDEPGGLAVAGDGSILIADALNNRILRLTVQFQDDEPPIDLPPIEPGGGNGTPDFNEDGKVDFNDFLPFAAAFGAMDPTFDLDGDGFVGFSDFLTFVAAFGRPTSSNPAQLASPPVWLRR